MVDEEENAELGEDLGDSGASRIPKKRVVTGMSSNRPTSPKALKRKLSYLDNSPTDEKKGKFRVSGRGSGSEVSLGSIPKVVYIIMVIVGLVTAAVIVTFMAPSKANLTTLDQGVTTKVNNLDKAIRSSLDTLTSTVVKDGEKLATTGSTVTTLSSTVSGLKTDASGLRSDLTKLTGEISSKATTADTAALKASLTKLDTLLTTLETKLGSLSDNLSGQLTALKNTTTSSGLDIYASNITGGLQVQVSSNRDRKVVFKVSLLLGSPVSSTNPTTSSNYSGTVQYFYSVGLLDRPYEIQTKYSPSSGSWVVSEVSFVTTAVQVVKGTSNSWLIYYNPAVLGTVLGTSGYTTIIEAFDVPYQTVTAASPGGI